MIHALSQATSAPAQSSELREQISRRGQPQPATTRPQGDVVELSDAARRQVEAGADPPIREHLVARIRAEIAAGTYLTDDKIDKAVERLHRELFGR